MKRERDNRPWILAGVMLTAIGITAGIALVQRMSNETLAVLAGALCGVGASIPTSLLIVWTTARERERDNRRRREQPYGTGIQIPPIILQSPPQLTGPDPYGQPTRGTTVVQGGHREFQVVGDEKL